MTRAFYRIEHETRYVHASQVSMSQHVACLTPRPLERQAVHASKVDVDPHPADRVERTDYHGNLVTQLSILRPYSELRVTATSLVEVRDAGQMIDPEASPAWESVRDAGVFRRGIPLEDSAEFRYPSPYIQPAEELAAFARTTFIPGRPLLAAAIDLMQRIHDEFQFDPGVTTITTPVSRVLSERRGVCQDFAHLQIACLRSIGIPARYTSGYLLTDPPPGSPRLTGADASHAWLAVCCPRYGWVDLDPTNAVLPGLRHVTLAWGRDYGDVSPLRGVVLGGGDHELSVGVSVVPAPAEPSVPGEQADLG
jgi:transglutaminase-like putative cysteine protease